MLGRERVERLRRASTPVLNLALFTLALWGIDHVLREYDYREVVSALGDLGSAPVLLALGLTALGYLALVGYDVVAFRFAGRPLPVRVMLAPSFISFAVANSAPANVLTAGGLRYRLYEERGLSVTEAAVVAGFDLVTYALGLCFMAGSALLLDRVNGTGPPVGISAHGGWLGGLLLAVAVSYLVLARFGPRHLQVWNRTVPVPDARTAVAQLTVSLLDWICSSAALWVLLVSVAPVPYLTFLVAFFVAQAATLLLPIPGGLGVFEAVILLLRPSDAQAPALLAGLLVYRAVYFLLPLLVAGVLLGLRWARRIEHERDPWASFQEAIRRAAPILLSWVTFVSGLLLLVGGAIPPDQRRLAWLGEVLPLAVIEASHFLASVAGAVLLLLAWGLQRGVRLAYDAVRALFIAGILSSLGRGLEVRLAVLLTAVLLLLQMAGRSFPRSASLLREPLPWGWIFAVGASLIGTAWLGGRAYRSVDLTSQVWWRFTLFGTAPRFLRAAVGTFVVALLFSVARVLANRAPPPASLSDHGRGSAAARD